MKMKKFLAGVLASALTFSAGLIPETAREVFPYIQTALTASAETSGTCGDNLTWILSNDGVLTISGNGDMYDYTYTIHTGEHDSPFYDLPDIKSVIIEDGVTSIGDWAFYNCQNIENVALGNDVKTIGYSSFYKCRSLEQVDFDKNLKTIGELSFCSCINLIDIYIPNSVIEIGSQAFDGCSRLESVTIPDGISKINSYVFYNCKNLKEINIPDSVKSIGEMAICGCNSLENVIIPESVSSIDNAVFSSCENLKSITILNPNCEIFDNAVTICNGYDNELKSRYFYGTIYGYSGSTAEKYAQKYNYNFKEIGSSPSDTTSKGDFNGDGKTDLEDVIGIYKYIQLRISYGDLTAGDYNGDGMINMFDAIGIAKHILENNLYDKNSTASGKVCAGSIYADGVTSMSLPLYIDNEYSNGVFIKIKCPDGFTLTDISDAIVDDLKTGKAVFASGSSYKTYTPFTELKFDIAESVPYGTYNIEIEVLALDNNGSCGYGGTIAKEIIKYLKGDISRNNKIDLYDAIEIAKSLIGKRKFTDDEKNIADFNGDGKVDLYDAIGIAKYLLKH